MPLSDTQAVLLVAAANRDDRVIPISDRLKGGAAENVARQLLNHRFAEEIEVAANAPFWRQGDDDIRIGLRITPRGLAAIGIDAEDDSNSSENDSKDGLETQAAARTGGAPAANSTKPANAPRTGGKRALVIELLGRANGASIDELTEATGWLPHTVRAALTRLRQGGLAIGRGLEAGGSRYAIRTESMSADPRPVEAAGDQPAGAESAVAPTHETSDPANNPQDPRPEDPNGDIAGA